ncbi:unnamed protein product [Bursaphelenchus xylophilus]|uniref:protein-disulfide reductase n=1 Tax=Bursaphelenchus xylophilus TaxID=6326 RepID=A0A1I7RIJ7_BURXY|nr:unnamed protein product [Bursaphelenchus xylophilus]CAG9118820.1 unnamed protein product [Bursaphelenchus xylophilus]
MSKLLADTQLFRKGSPNPVNAATELKGKMVALFFGAKNIDPELTEKLKALYAAGKPMGLEIVFISHDVNEDEQKAFLNECPDWLYTKYGDSKSIGLLQRYQLKEIPTVVVVQPGGTPLENNAVKEIKKQAPAALLTVWKKKTTE